MQKYFGLRDIVAFIAHGLDHFQVWNLGCSRTRDGGMPKQSYQIIACREHCIARIPIAFVRSAIQRNGRKPKLSFDLPSRTKGHRIRLV